MPNPIAVREGYETITTIAQYFGHSCDPSIHYYAINDYQSEPFALLNTSGQYILVRLRLYPDNELKFDVKHFPKKPSNLKISAIENLLVVMYSLTINPNRYGYTHDLNLLDLNNQTDLDKILAYRHENDYMYPNVRQEFQIRVQSDSDVYMRR